MLLRDLLDKIHFLASDADADIGISGICCDTRKLKEGEAFVAIKGYESDGRLFIGEAAGRGASCVFCEEAPAVQIPYVIVEDSRKALAALSAAWFDYPSDKLKIVGVTGTNGKTTITSMIKQVIEKCTGAKVGLIGTNTNMIGDKEYHTEHTTPESYDIHEFLALMVKEGCEYAVMEVSSHALYLSRVFGIEFEVGVYTNLSPDHLDFHGSMEEYAKTKSLLFSCCRNAVINIDDEYAPFMIGNTACKTLTYAVKDGSADYIAKDIKLHADKVDFCALTTGSLCRVEFPVTGMFSVYNALAVMLASMLLGFDTNRITDAMRTCTGVKGRAEVVLTGCDYTVMIDYAHTPDALANIINTARGFTHGRVVTLFGCGGDRDKTKRPLMGQIAGKLSDYVIVTSDNPRTEEPGAIINDILMGMRDIKTQYRVIENRREAIYWALENAKPSDTLIIAGKGHETYQIIGKEKRHFDEREVIAEYFENAECKK